MNCIQCALVAAFTLASTAAMGCDQVGVATTTMPLPEQSAEPLRQALALAETAKQIVPPEAVIIGDSLVARWPLNALQSSFKSQNVYKMGVEGDKTQNVLWRLEDSTIRSWKPKIVAILIGTNNLSAGDSACSISIALQKIVYRIDAVWDHPHLVLIALLPRGEGWSFRQQDRKNINRFLQKITRTRKNTSIAIYKNELTCQLIWPCQKYDSDRLHLSPDGYSTMSQYLMIAARRD